MSPANAVFDFIIGDMVLAIEAKATAAVTRQHLKGLRSLATEHPVRRRMIVCLEPRPRRTPDGIDIVPADTFVQRLREGELVPGAGGV